MRILGYEQSTQMGALQQLAQIRQITRANPAAKTEAKLIKLQELNQAFLNIVTSSEQKPVDLAQKILNKRIDNAAALKSLRDSKLTVDIGGHENLLSLIIDKVNHQYSGTGKEYSLDTIDSLTSPQKNEFIDQALKLPKTENSVYWRKASEYDSSAKGDDFLQEAVMTNEDLTKATIDLISELKSDPESLKLFLSDRSLREESLVVLTYLNRLNQGLAADAHSPTLDLQRQVSTFLEELKVKSKKDEIGNSFGGLARVSAISGDEKLVNEILNTKSDEVLLKSIKELAKLHNHEPNFLTGFHYIQSNSFRDKLKAAYGSGIFGEMQATALQARIKSVLNNEIQGSEAFSTALDKFDDNPLASETKEAYESFIQAQRDAMSASPGLSDEINTTKSQIAALKGDTLVQVTIKTDISTDLDIAKDSLVALLETKPSEAGKTALNLLLDILIRHSDSERQWKKTSDGSTNPEDHENYKVAAEALKILLKGLNECFKHFNQINSNGSGNHNLMNLLHDRMLDYVLPDKKGDPTNQYSALDDLKHKLIDSFIDRELSSGGHGSEANQRLIKIKNEKNLSDLKNDFPALYEEFSKLHKRTIDDLYVIAALPYNPRQEADVKSRLTNAAMTDDPIHYEIIQSTFNRKIVTG
jgi:hypothetical protein